jgi:hypothetical protein
MSPREVEDHFSARLRAVEGQLAEVTIEFLKPVQQRVREITDDQLNQILNKEERRRGDRSCDSQAGLQQSGSLRSKEVAWKRSYLKHRWNIPIRLRLS